MDATERIYQLVKQWSVDSDWEQSNLALCEIALLAGCTATEANEDRYVCAIAWLQKNYPNAYLWALGQRCIGHPAAIWATAPLNQPELIASIPNLRNS